jgi:hypothetical protein
MNPILLLDVKDAVVIWLLAHAAIDALLIGVAGVLWFLSHFKYW